MKPRHGALCALNFKARCCFLIGRNDIHLYNAVIVPLCLGAEYEMKTSELKLQAQIAGNARRAAELEVEELQRGTWELHVTANISIGYNYNA